MPHSTSHDWPELSRRSYSEQTSIGDWEEIWEAGPYFERISALLEQAREYVVFVGWQIDSRLPMPVSSPRSSTEALEAIKDKVIRLCNAKPSLHVYFLIWNHAAVYIPERESWQSRIWEDIHPQVHFIFDNSHPLGGSHHEKICLIDGETAFCGGIDLCDDRWDSPAHLYEDARRSLDGKRETHGPYHDLAVRVTGPICAALHAHVESRWRSVSRVPFPGAPRTPAAQRHARAYLSRTWTPVESPRRPTREIEYLFSELIQAARQSILIEGQYFWSRKILDLLVAKMKETRETGFKITLVLADLESTRSLTRRMADYELRLTERLERAARFYGTRLVVGTPYIQPPPGKSPGKARAVYIHSKLLIIDDRWLSIGSANLAARAFRLDTEVNLTFEARAEEERAHVREVTRYVEEHWNLRPAGLAAAHVNPSLHLRGFHSRLRQPGRVARLKTAIFDPPIPWLHPIKREFQRQLGRAPGLRAFAFALALAWGVAITLSLGSAWPLLPSRSWLLVDAGLLCGSWCLGSPFFLIAIFVATTLGPARGPAVVVASLWVATTTGYLFGRAFPFSARRFFALEHEDASRKWLGWRSFAALLETLLSPRVRLRTKIAIQGVHFVPLPWFVLANWVILPSVVYTLCRALASHGPRPLETWLQARPWAWTLALAAPSILRIPGIKWKNTV